MLAVLAAVILVAPLVPLQQGHTPEPLSGRDIGGEYTSKVLDDLIAGARQTGEPVFVVSRLGKADKTRYNRRRLHNAVTRLVDYPVALPAEQVVSAIGQRTKGSGRVEFYLGGRLFYVVTFRANRDFIVDCCEREDDVLYYPRRRRAPKYSWP